MTGQVEAIHISRAAGAPMAAMESVEALADSGLAGDRYLTGVGFYSARPRTDGGRELTLIEAETLATLAAEHGLTLTAADSRRNLTTRGLRLTELIGRHFQIGDVVCEGVDHCSPCQHLVEVTGRPVLEPLVGRGGIRARICRRWLRVSDAITIVAGDDHRPAGPGQRPAGVRRRRMPVPRGRHRLWPDRHRRPSAGWQAAAAAGRCTSPASPTSTRPTRGAGGGPVRRAGASVEALLAGPPDIVDITTLRPASP
jgi:hypothetical protein